ncbi:MAG: hypothetical protein CL844_04450 [Crocinitomicaceae bacterium]|nr:hypothetical protein [Crocinitomicaceae bacterium]|tara:strand:- start:32426 stop:32800 length:375 start_codon:yes stop_codon:yes gene_type:complete
MRYFFIIFFIGFIFSCSDSIEGKVKPNNLIPSDKMAKVMNELNKLECYIQGEYNSVAQYNMVMINSGDSLMRSFNITKEQFEESLEYYATHQDLLKGIHDKILDDYNRELGELSIENKETLDSL